MAKVIVEMEFDCEQFDEISDEAKFQAIETVLESGAESTASYIKVMSIEVTHK